MFNVRNLFGFLSLPCFVYKDAGVFSKIIFKKEGLKRIATRFA